MRRITAVFKSMVFINPSQQLDFFNQMNLGKRSSLSQWNWQQNHKKRHNLLSLESSTRSSL